jgi:hypothetical protein
MACSVADRGAEASVTERWGAATALVRFSGGAGSHGSVGAVTLEDGENRELARWGAGEGELPEVRSSLGCCRQRTQQNGKSRRSSERRVWGSSISRSRRQAEGRASVPALQRRRRHGDEPRARRSPKQRPTTEARSRFRSGGTHGLRGAICEPAQGPLTAAGSPAPATTATVRRSVGLRPPRPLSRTRLPQGPSGSQHAASGTGFALDNGDSVAVAFRR